MTIDPWLILALWILFIVAWGIAARGAKRTIGPRRWGRHSGVRLGIIVLILVALRIPALRHALRSAQLWVTGAAVGTVGVALCALGIGLALWARVHLGRNWGIPMSRKEDPELVTTGPYALIRHPIYAGILLAMLGSALGESIVWLLPLILFGAYFIYSARREEKLMLEQFPAQYPAYRSRTRMLVPFVL